MQVCCQAVRFQSFNVNVELAQDGFKDTELAIKFVEVGLVAFEAVEVEGVKALLLFHPLLDAFRFSKSQKVLLRDLFLNLKNFVGQAGVDFFSFVSHDLQKVVWPVSVCVQLFVLLLYLADLARGVQRSVADLIADLLGLDFQLLEHRIKLHILVCDVVHLVAKFADVGHFVAEQLHFRFELHQFPIYLVQVLLLSVHARTYFVFRHGHFGVNQGFQMVAVLRLWVEATEPVEVLKREVAAALGLQILELFLRVHGRQRLEHSHRIKVALVVRLLVGQQSHWVHFLGRALLAAGWLT